MKTLPFNQRHLDELAKYGLHEFPRREYQCLLFEPGESITREGDVLSRLLLVVRGRAKVCRTAPNGKSLILCWYISQGLIGEIELLTGRDRATAAVISTSELECVAIDFAVCARELKKNLTFSNKLGEVLAAKLAESDGNLASSTLYTGEQRLCSYILQTSNRDVFCDVLTDVTCSIGVSYRHLLRMLSRLCQEGVLEKRETGYYIRNRKMLASRSCTGY